MSALREHLKAKLPEYMVPAAFVFLDALPLTNNGKVDRKALPAPEQQRPELARRYVGAANSRSKRTLARIWSKVLRVEQVGVHDNFFELGGDSILSIQIISLARREGLDADAEAAVRAPDDRRARGRGRRSMDESRAVAAEALSRATCR